MVIWTFFGIALLWDWNETWLFQSCGPCWTFQICWHIKCFSGFPYCLQFKSEFWNKELTIWAVDSSRFLLTVWSFFIFSCQEYNQGNWIEITNFSIDYLVMSMCRVFSCVVGTGCLLWPVYSLGKTLLNFALLDFVLQGQTCLLLQVSLDFLFLCYNVLWWKEHLFWCYF